MVTQQASFRAPSVIPTYTTQTDAARHTYMPEYWNATIPTAVVNEPEGHGVVKNWMTPTPDNKTSAYTMYTVVYPTAYMASNLSTTRGHGNLTDGNAKRRTK